MYLPSSGGGANCSTGPACAPSSPSLTGYRVADRRRMLSFPSTQFLTCPATRAIISSSTHLPGNTAHVHHHTTALATSPLHLVFAAIAPTLYLPTTDHRIAPTVPTTDHRIIALPFPAIVKGFVDAAIDAIAARIAQGSAAGGARRPVTAELFQALSACFERERHFNRFCGAGGEEPPAEVSVFQNLPCAC